MSGHPARIKAGLIGCGRIGAQTSDSLRSRLPPGWLPLSHAEAIRSQKELDLAALCDTDAQRLAKAAETYGVARCYSDYRVLIDEARPEILSIATRTHGRVQIVAYAAEHRVKGIHVEKPFALNLADCDDALRQLRVHNVHVTYGATRRYMDIYRRAKNLIDAGEIGEVEQILIEHGRTSLLWNHPHSADLLLFFSGTAAVQSVQASCVVRNVSADGMTVDDDPVVENALVRFENGVSGVITAARGMNTRISGTKGMLTVLADGSGIEIRANRSGTGPYFLDLASVTSSVTVSGTQSCMVELANSIRSPTVPTIALDEIRAGLAILLAAVYSNLKKGRAVDLNEIPPQFTVTGRSGALYA